MITLYTRTYNIFNFFLIFKKFEIAFYTTKLPEKILSCVKWFIWKYMCIFKIKIECWQAQLVGCVSSFDLRPRKENDTVSLKELWAGRFCLHRLNIMQITVFQHFLWKLGRRPSFYVIVQTAKQLPFRFYSEKNPSIKMTNVWGVHFWSLSCCLGFA